MNFYDSIIEGAQELPATERGQLYAAVLEYLYYRREPDFPMRPAPKAIYVSFRPILDNQLSAAERGRKGGRPRKQKSKPKAEVSETEELNETSAFREGEKGEKPTESKTKAEVSEKVPFSKSEQEQEQELEKTTANAVAKKRARFVPPTPEEVDAYIAERGYSGFDGEGFCAFYASKGWKVGNQPMRDWRRACVTWQKRREAECQATRTKEADGFDDFAI